MLKKYVIRLEMITISYYDQIIDIEIWVGDQNYESLNVNLQLVLLTQVLKQFSHPKINIKYHGNTI